MVTDTSKNHLEDAHHRVGEKEDLKNVRFKSSRLEASSSYILQLGSSFRGKLCCSSSFMDGHHKVKAVKKASVICDVRVQLQP